LSLAKALSRFDDSVAAERALAAAPGWQLASNSALIASGDGRDPSHRIACRGVDMDRATNALFTDLHQLNMVQAYLDRGETETAVGGDHATLIHMGLAQGKSNPLKS
jgi:hypothetical protein